VPFVAEHERGTQPLPDYFDLAPAWARSMFQSLTDQLGAVMAEVTVQDTDLQNLSTQLTSIADDLETELKALNVPPGDLAPVQAIVDRLRSDVTVPAPAPPAPTTPAPSAGPGTTGTDPAAPTS
jgi:hypothetical protein